MTAAEMAIGGRGEGEGVEILEAGSSDGDEFSGSIRCGKGGGGKLECWPSRRGDGVAEGERMTRRGSSRRRKGKRR